MRSRLAQCSFKYFAYCYELLNGVSNRVRQISLNKKPDGLVVVGKQRAINSFVGLGEGPPHQMRTPEATQAATYPVVFILDHGWHWLCGWGKLKVGLERTGRSITNKGHVQSSSQ